MAKKTDAMRKAGADAMDKFFSGLQESPENASEKRPEQKPSEPTETAQKSSEEPQRGEKKVFSFRAPENEVISWRAYAEAKGIKVDDLGEKALQEYIKRHALTGDQKELYEKINELRSLKRGLIR